MADDAPVTGRQVADWVEKNITAGEPLDRWQLGVLDAVFAAPYGTEPPPAGDPAAWQSVGHLIDDDSVVTVVDDTQDWLQDAVATGKLTAGSVTVSLHVTGDTASRRLAAIVHGCPTRRQFRGLEDNVTGRVHVDGLHPASPLMWEQTVEGCGPDGNPLVVCEHCGEPVPCVEKIIRHMDTDWHQRMCIPTGTCGLAGRPIDELPRR